MSFQAATDLLVAALPLVGAAAISVATTLLTIRFNWGVEQQRARLVRRQAEVDAWRAMLREWPHNDGMLVVAVNEGLPLAKHADYPSLRKILPEDLRAQVEGRPPANGDAAVDLVVTLGGGQLLRTRLMDLIDEQERRWRLV